MSEFLTWPTESASAVPAEAKWRHAGSNLVLDFHGDPVLARLVVFSDGNHHMALEQSLQAFLADHPETGDIFYATTPPGVLVNYLEQGRLVLGNLTLSRLPHVFISPPGILKKLQQLGHVSSHQVFMQSRGNVLLVRKGNPKNIQGLPDLLRDDVRLFISNPKTETASYEVYHNTILALADEAGLDSVAFTTRLADTSRTVFGQCIHHREAPQCLFDERADMAMIYYHLALRYTRIFPDVFELVPLTGTADAPVFSAANETTNYHVGLVGDGGQWGQAFIEFLQSETVSKIYAEHGLQRAP